MGALRRVPALGLAALAAAAALAAPAVRAEDDEALLLPAGELPEAQLVDVSIDLFSTGVPDKPAFELRDKGIRLAVRKSEARYFAIHLRNTLQSSGQWGAVRVVPGGGRWSELLVTGEIEKSNGKDLTMWITARDASGREWLRHKYHERADVAAYAKERPVDARDPFQSLYHRIANDLVRARDKVKPRELAAMRELAGVRFAATMSPQPYASYVETSGKGRSRAVRLPATDDPMMARIAAVRERDDRFVDTLNEYYSDFYARMDKPYDDWRAYSYEEQLLLDKIERKSTLKKILGAAAVLGGIVMGATDEDGRGASDLGDVLVMGGIVAVQSGFEDGKSKGIHKAALTELADSFEGDVTPLVLDVDGKVVHLSGSAEAQFRSWRELLARIAATDEPIPADINVLPTAPVEAAQP